MMSGSGWTKTGRMIMLQISVRPEQVKFELLLGPGDKDLRDCITRELARVKGKPYRDTSKWTQLAGNALRRDIEGLEPQDYQRVFDEIKAFFDNFIERQVLPFDEPLRDAIAGRG